jgi:hypothetical protein
MSYPRKSKTLFGSGKAMAAAVVVWWRHCCRVVLRRGSGALLRVARRRRASEVGTAPRGSLQGTGESDVSFFRVFGSVLLFPCMCDVCGRWMVMGPCSVRASECKCGLSFLEKATSSLLIISIVQRCFHGSCLG